MAEHDSEPRTTHLTWRKSKASSDGSKEGCVEVAWLAGYVLVRDSKDPGESCLTFGRTEWRRFLATLGGPPAEPELPAQREHSHQRCWHEAVQ